MIETLVIATDGSDSAERAIEIAVDVAERFDATVHALSVIDVREIESVPESVEQSLRQALTDQSTRAVETVKDHTRPTIETSVREGRPATEILNCVREVDADAVVTGTRGRHGEHHFLIGSVAERVVNTCPVPVLTVRQLDDDEDPRRTTI